jgi:hypothetical protein
LSVYEFTLRLGSELTDDEADALCAVISDAGVSTGPGVTHIEFAREAPGWAEALGSAVRDIETVPGLMVTGAGQDDLVSALDIAHRTRRSREAVRLWASGQRGPGGFPAPEWVSPGGERFWSWARVARWVRDNLNLAVDLVPEEIRQADQILKARQALAASRRMLDMNEDMRRQFRPLLDVLTLRRSDSSAR